MPRTCTTCARPDRHAGDAALAGLIAAGPPRQAWEQRVGESAKAYAGFLRFRDAGAGRTLSLVARMLSVSKQAIQRWSSEHDWPARAAAWDQHLQARIDAAVAEAHAADAASLAARQRAQVAADLAAATALMRLALRAMQPHPLLDPDGRVARDAERQIVHRPPTIRELAAAGVALDKAIRHRRLAGGLPSDITHQDLIVQRQIREANEVNAALLHVLQDVLCDECRDRALAELERIARRHIAMADADQQ